MSDKLTELMDREAIRDCLYLYCRGVDRGDEASLRRAYWPDAYDAHGTLYSGPAEGFIQLALKAFATNPRNIHQVSNVLIEFRANGQAAVESYFNAYQRSVGGDGVTRQVLLAGRYCDLFEQRGHEWRILKRVVVYDWVESQDPGEGDGSAMFGARAPVGQMWPDDPVYHIGA